MHPLFSSLPGRLLPWYDANHRDLPWRQDREPYHVWLSEIMLQQTRVEAVKGYYARFLAALPTVEALAQAPAEQVNKLWEGLGYYTRARNLQKAAGQILSLHNGVFPRDYAAIRALAGIGDYTAGAIGSICFELPTPAVDGNVLRVCSRLTADDSPIDKPQTKKELTAQLAAVYPPGHCGDFTQALMELGATVCLPNGAPLCARCPLADLCLAHREGTETELPVKTPKKPRRVEEMTVLLLHQQDVYALQKRPDAGLLAGLWEFPHVSGTLDADAVLTLLDRLGAVPEDLERVVDRTHIFTHVQWQMRGFFIRCRTLPPDTVHGKPEQYALPTAFRQFLE